MKNLSITERSIDDRIDQLEKACARVADSVALIHAVLGKPTGAESCIGTAYCVDKRGYFVTALHLVHERISSFLVLRHLFELQVVAVAEEHDLAIVQIVHPDEEFAPVSFATSLADDEIVGGLGYPERGLSVDLCSFLARYAGPVVDGVGPHGLILDGDRLQNGLAFVGTVGKTGGFSGGPIINEDGLVVASTAKGDDDLGLIVGPAAHDIVRFTEQYLPA